MAAKFILFALIVAGAALATAKDCDCKDRSDTKELWDFLNKLSPDIDDLTDEEKDMYSVLPGVLSPLFECNCLDKARRKREALPEESDSVENIKALAEDSKLNVVRGLRQRRSIRYGSRSCPAGFARVGYLCVREELLD